MALDGVTVDSTEKLAGTWCGDLLQIIEELPKDYNLIDCCLADMFRMSKTCYHKFGVNENGVFSGQTSRNAHVAAEK